MLMATLMRIVFAVLVALQFSIRLKFWTLTAMKCLEANQVKSALQANWLHPVILTTLKRLQMHIATTGSGRATLV
jgi:hypothetical protein